MHMATKVLEWVKSNQVNLKRLTSLGTSIGFIYGMTVINGTIGIEKYRTVQQMRIKSSAVPPDTILRALIREVKDEFSSWKMKQNGQVKDSEDFETRLKEKVRFMMILDYNPIHKGSIWGRYGCIIGIPRYFTYYNPEKVEQVHSLSRGKFLSALTSGKIDRSRVPLDSLDNLALAKFLILTTEEKKFVLMREMISCQRNSDHVTAVLRLVTIASSLGLMYFAKEFLIENIGITFSMLVKTNLHSNSMLTKMAGRSLYVLILGIGLVSYYSLLFMYNNRREKQTDRTVAAMSREYAEGGRGYYNSILSLNQTCRCILGPKDGAYVYTSKGDMKWWFFNQKTRVTERLAIMEDYLSKYSEENSEPATDRVDQTKEK